MARELALAVASYFLSVIENPDAALVASKVLQTDANYRPGCFDWEALRPFQNYHPWGCENIFNSQGFKVVKTFNSIQIGVVDLPRLAINMDKRKRRAGDIVLLRRTETCNDAFGERSLAATQVARQEDEYGRFQAFREGMPPVNTFLF